MKTASKAFVVAFCIVGLLLSSGCSPDTVGRGQPGALDSSAQSAKLTVAPLDRTGSSGSFKSLGSTATTAGLPTELPVYRVVPDEVTRSWVESRAAKLGLTGDVAMDDRRFMVRGDSGAFEVEKDTGSFDYTTDAFVAQTQPLVKVLDAKEYRARAESFLSNAGLMCSQAEFHDVNFDNVVGLYEGGRWVERPYMIEVRFSHTPLGGIAFDKGVGPKIIVQFGEDGKVLGAMSVWRNVERDRTYGLKTVDGALAEVRHGDAQIFGVGKAASGTIEDISLSYLNEPLGYEQIWVLPAYVMRGHLSDGTPFTTVSRAIPGDLLQVDDSLNDTAVSAPLSTGRK